jgi:hypothetical protein
MRAGAGAVADPEVVKPVGGVMGLEVQLGTGHGNWLAVIRQLDVAAAGRNEVRLTKSISWLPEVSCTVPATVPSVLNSSMLPELVVAVKKVVLAALVMLFG